MTHRRISDRLQPLLTLGHPGPDAGTGARKPEDWRRYAELGLGPDDAPDLIAMATDRALHRAREPACYAPLHAWRALGQFRCQAAIRPLLDLLDDMGNAGDDWGLEELPQALALIGPAALPELRRLLPDRRRNLWARLGAARAMSEIARVHPDQRAPVVKALTDQLALSRYNEPDFNGLLVSELIDLRAVESAGAIRRAYDSGHVDERVCGPLPDVLADLGMVTEQVPLPEGTRISQGTLDEVMREYNARQRPDPARPKGKPLTSAEREQSLRELGDMLRARLNPDSHRDAGDDPSVRARDLAYRALDCDSIAESVGLADEALALDPDCVDALVLKAERTIDDPKELLGALERAVEAGERSLGRDFFEKHGGHFWGMLETRPYMRARARVANLLRERGRTAEAAAHYEAMLRLNADDNLGLRYALVGCYLRLGKTEAMRELMARFDEESAFFLWPTVFMHVLDGKSAEAEGALARARAENPHVEALITEVKPMPRERPGAYSPGGPDEAVFVAENLLPALGERPEMRGWLARAAGTIIGGGAGR